MGIVGLPAWEAVVGSHRQGSGRAAIAGVKAPAPTRLGGLWPGQPRRGTLHEAGWGRGCGGRALPRMHRAPLLPSRTPLAEHGGCRIVRAGGPALVGRGFLWGEGHQEGRPKPSLALGFGTSLNVRRNAE